MSDLSVKRETRMECRSTGIFALFYVRKVLLDAPVKGNKEIEKRVPIGMSKRSLGDKCLSDIHILLQMLSLITYNFVRATCLLIYILYLCIIFHMFNLNMKQVKN